jgi:hypothetical protein
MAVAYALGGISGGLADLAILLWSQKIEPAERPPPHANPPLGRHADRAIQAQGLPIEIAVARQLHHQAAQFLGLAQSGGLPARSGKADRRRCSFNARQKGRPC